MFLHRKLGHYLCTYVYNFSMKVLRVVTAILALSLLSACGSDPAALKKEACEKFLKGGRQIEY